MTQPMQPAQQYQQMPAQPGGYQPAQQYQPAGYPQQAPAQQYQQAPAQPAGYPQQYQQAPAQPPARTFAGVGDFIDPTIPSAGDFSKVRVRDLRGRAVLVSVEKSERVKNELKTTGDGMETRLTLNILVVDGGPLPHGGGRDNDFVPTHTINTPCYVEGVLTSHVNVERVLGKHAGTGALILGRFERGVARDKSNSNPWNFVPLCDTMPPNVRAERNIPESQVQVDQAARAQAAEIWAAKLMGAWQSPDATEVNSPAAAYAAAAAQPAQQYQQAGYQPAQQHQQMPAQPAQQMPAQPAQQMPGGYPQVQPGGYQQAPAQPAGYPQQYQQMPAQQMPAPANWDPQQFAGLSPEQQQQVWASINQQAAPGATPGF